eukprot:TRINITY_DN79_c0_g1_i2.p3 TRINITY_DN79_c0_g1~~TRINITY_DN79_c0_g1_i2.p3  ORF type:complete len:110 (+),score=39.71 TRINITY_DN79_c0_g1_i2:67-396(+)
MCIRDRPHTVPYKVTGKGGSVRLRLVPAPRGTGIVGSPVPKKVLSFAGIQDCYTSSRGKSRTRLNLLIAVYDALASTYKFLSPDFWAKDEVDATPIERFHAVLNEKAKY